VVTIRTGTAPIGAEGIRTRATRLIRFGLVGVSGVAINTVALMVAVDAIGLHYMTGVILATQASTTWNYVLSEVWVFDRSDRDHGGMSRYLQFWSMNNLALVARGPLVWLLTDGLGAHYLLSNIVSLCLLMLVRYVVADRWIWRPNRASTSPITTPAPSGGSSTRHLPPVSGPALPTSPWTTWAKKPHSVLSWSKRWATRLGVTCMIGVAAATLRLTFLDSLGFNSDEAVYAGQGASLAGHPVLIEYFPIFRAHPLLFQTTLSVVFQIWGVSPLAGRLTSAAFGLATVVVCYLLGKTLYGRRAGAVAALILAVMPYHVVVTRQVLLDGPMVFFATLSLYLLARFAQSGRVSMLYASAAAIGLTVLTNERSVVLLGGAYLFFALVSSVKVRFMNLVMSMGIFVLMVSPYPLSVFFSGKSTTGEQFLAWQLFRRANHGAGFYAETVPPAVGWLTLLAIVGGLVFMRKELDWRVTLLGCWCVVPLAFFQIWPVKGFQYLLALAPPLAVVAGWALASIPDHVTTVVRLWLPRGPATRLQVLDRNEPRGLIRMAVIAVTVASLALSSWGRIAPAGAGDSFLAGSGGVPGGREAGEWVGANLPEGAKLMAIGPSMANIIQWYGDRKTYGLSVSPNPLHRNPVYEPVVNPDLLLRGGDLHYLVWDSFSASRSQFFSDKLLSFAERYHGRIVHQEFIEMTTDDGETIQQPIIVIYEVRP
jgi:putative flippase GtrA